MFNYLANRLKIFANDTRGSVLVEFIIFLPMLYWALMASYVFFDGYRQSALNLKSAYTISDLLSRETETINPDYIDSMYSLLEVMTRSGTSIQMRISVVRFDEGDDKYYVDWSQVRGMTTTRTDANIGDVESQLPVMPDNERVILVEVWHQFVPLFNVGLNTTELEDFVYARPRFAPQVVWSDS